MLQVANAVVGSAGISAVIFAVIAVAMLVFAAYMGFQAVVSPPAYLHALRWALVVLSLGFACALLYESAALASGQRLPTISVITDAAFRAHPIYWVSLFSLLMLVTGALAIHFTRVASLMSTVVATQRRIGAAGPSLVSVLLFAGAVVVLSQLVRYLTPIVARPGPDDPGFSWWVLFVGAGAYGVGALVAWAFNWRPCRPPDAQRAACRLPIRLLIVATGTRASQQTSAAVGLARAIGMDTANTAMPSAARTSDTRLSWAEGRGESRSPRHVASCSRSISSPSEARLAA